MLGLWSARIRATEFVLFDSEEQHQRAAFRSFAGDTSVGRFSLLAAVTADEERTIRRAMFVFRLFVAFLEFCIQFTVILGLAFLLLRVFHAPFWLLAGIVYSTTFILAFAVVFPLFIKQINAARSRKSEPLLTKEDRNTMLGQFVKGYIVNLVITTIVLFLSAAIVGVSPTIGPIDYGTLIRNNSYAMGGATFSALLLTLFNQSFGLKPPVTSS